MATATATDALIPLNFRHRESRKRVLVGFMHADGHQELTPILREAVEFYIAKRLQGGRAAIDAVLGEVERVKIPA